MLPAEALLWPVAKLVKAAPLQTLSWSVAAAANVTVLIKREDLLHSQWGGNKIYKSAHYFSEFKKSRFEKILTFGGPYSNHLLAMAAQCHQARIPLIAVIRGDAPPQLSPTLKDVVALGAYCHFIPRADYREKHSDEVIENLRSQLGDFFIVPEGAGGLTGSLGCFEWAKATLDQSGKVDAICLSVGTGGTCAGVLAAAQGLTVHGFMALKGSSNKITEMHQHILQQAMELRQSRGLQSVKQALSLETDYHFGGYAKGSPGLYDFMQTFESETQVPLDRVYTAKLFYGIEQKLSAGYWPPRTRLLVMHSGGLQGNRTHYE